MTVSFDVDFAMKYGIYEAIFMSFLEQLIIQRVDTIDYDGRTWIMGGSNRFAKRIPFFSAYQIKKMLKYLVDMGVLRVGDFNETPMEHTYWYALNK